MTMYAPAAQCEIVSTNGNSKWALHASAAMSGDASVVVYPFMTGVTVTVARNLISALQVTFDAPYEEGIRMLYEDAGGASAFNMGNLIRARVGYADMNQWTPWYQGMLNQGGDGVTIGPEGVSGTISAQMYGWPDIQTQLNLKAAAKTPVDLLRQLVEAMGRKLNMGPGAEQVLSNAAAQSGHEVFACFGKNNMETVDALCKRFGLTWHLMDVGNLTTGDINEVLTIQSNVEVAQGQVMAGRQRLAFVMRGAFVPQAKQWPLLSWGPDPSMASWLGSVARASNAGVRFSGFDKRKGLALGLDVAPLESADAIYGAAAAKGAAQDRTDEKGVVLDKATVPGASTSELHTGPVPDSEKATDAARTQAQARMTDGNVAGIATLTTLGCPEVTPFDLIDVYGCSPRYDGPYEVMEVTHRFSPGTYETELKVGRRGTFGTDEPTPTTGTQGGQMPAGA